MEICELCMEEIVIGDDGHEHCGCEEECPCGCEGDESHCVYAAQQKRAADVLPCGHTQDHEHMLIETGEFVCDQCGAIHR